MPRSHTPRPRSFRLAAPLAALALCAAPAAAQPTSQAGIDAFNADVQRLWDRLRPAVERTIHKEARAKLEGLKQVSGQWEIEVTRFGGVKLGFAPAPGLRALSGKRLEVAAPAHGTWQLEVEADLKIRRTRGWPKFTVRLRELRVEVSQIKALARVELDDSDPYRPQVKRAGTPLVDFRVKLRSGRLFTDLLMRILSPAANLLARKAVLEALVGLTPELAKLQGLPGPVPGDGAAVYTDSGRPAPWDEVVANVEAKMRRYHLPHGTLLHSTSDTPTLGTWLEDYRNGGAGNVGGVHRQLTDGGDSAIWTGHYLAGEALRYASTQDPAALDNVRHAVRGLSALIEVHGETGLLARVAAPVASEFGQHLATYRDRRNVVRFMRGEMWIGSNGPYGISRDQYMGAFLGLSLAYEHVPDLAVRAECRLRIEQMLDYLIKTGWFVDEDRPEFDPMTPQGRDGFPTFWSPGIDQKLNALLIGERVVPWAKYDAEIAAVSPLAETEWLSNWMSSFDNQSYYKYNLAHGTYYNYFRHETDPTRRAHMERAFLVTRRMVGHHRNPHFELIHASVLPALRAQNHPAAKEGLRRFLDRPHRWATGPVVDLTGVTLVTIPQVSVPLPGQNAPPATITIASEPLDPVLRLPGGDFLWQREPFTPATPNGGNPYLEEPGIAITLPYWMGKYHGAW